MNKANKYSPEVRERVSAQFAWYKEQRGNSPSLWATVQSIAPKIGCSHIRHAARLHNPALRSAREQRDEQLVSHIEHIWQANWQV